MLICLQIRSSQERIQNIRPIGSRWFVSEQNGSPEKSLGNIAMHCLDWVDGTEQNGNSISLWCNAVIEMKAMCSGKHRVAVVNQMDFIEYFLPSRESIL